MRRSCSWAPLTMALTISAAGLTSSMFPATWPTDFQKKARQRNKEILVSLRSVQDSQSEKKQIEIRTEHASGVNHHLRGDFFTRGFDLLHSVLVGQDSLARELLDFVLAVVLPIKDVARILIERKGGRGEVSKSPGEGVWVSEEALANDYRYYYSRSGKHTKRTSRVDQGPRKCGLGS